MSKGFQDALNDFDRMHFDGALEIRRRGDEVELAPMSGWGGGPYRWMYPVRFLGVLVWIALMSNPKSSAGMRALHCGLVAWWMFLGARGHLRFFSTRPGRLIASWDANAEQVRLRMNGASALASEVTITAHAYGIWMSYWVQLPSRSAQHLVSSESHAPPVMARYFTDLCQALGCGFGGVVRQHGVAVAPVTAVLVAGALLGVAMPGVIAPFTADLLAVGCGIAGAVWAHRRMLTTLRAAPTPVQSSQRVYWRDPRDNQVKTVSVDLGELLEQPFIRLRNEPDAIVLGPTRYSRRSELLFALGGIVAWGCGIAAGVSSLIGVHTLSVSASMWLMLFGTLMFTRALPLHIRPVRTNKRTPIDESAYRTADDLVTLDLTDEPLRFVYSAPRFGTVADLWVQKNGEVTRVGEIEIGFQNERDVSSIARMLQSLDPRAELRSVGALFDRGWLSMLSLPFLLLLAWNVPTSGNSALPGVVAMLLPSVVITGFWVVIRRRVRNQVVAAFERW